VPTLIDRDTAVPLLRQEFAAVATLCDPLSDEQWDTPTCLPGWTVRDNVSHMLGTESLLLGLAAPEVEVTAGAHVRNAIGQANEVWVTALRPLPGAEVLTRFREVTGRRLAALDAMTQADFDAPSWTPAGPDETYGRFMRIRHFDCFLHEHDIRAALGLEDRPDPAQLGFALDEVVTGLGFVVGKRAGLPAGTRVRITLTGPAARELFVAVEERAQMVDALPAPPTVELQLPGVLFLRLSGGRLSALPSLDGDITVGGDREQAIALATNLAFTI